VDDIIILLNFPIHLSRTISGCLETWSDLSRAMYFGVLERVEDGWLLVGAGSLSSSSCFLAGLRGLFDPCDLHGRTSGRVSVVVVVSCHRMCVFYDRNATLWSS